eukprot:31003-Pelagococcus_subviridis.AAC.11
MHAVLRDVRYPQVMMLPHAPVRGLELAHDVLQKRRLTRPVRADDGDARGEVHARVDAVQNLRRRRRVRKRNLLDPQHRLMLILYAVQRSRVRERDERLIPAPGRLPDAAAGRPGHRRGEPPRDGPARRVRGRARAELAAFSAARAQHRGRAQPARVAVASAVAGAHAVADRGLARGFRVGFDRVHEVFLHARKHQPRVRGSKVLKPAVVRRQRLILEVHDVGGDGREEVVVVRDHEHGRVRQRAEVRGEPVDRADVEVVRRLVQEEEVGFL